MTKSVVTGSYERAYGGVLTDGADVGCGKGWGDAGGFLGIRLDFGG